MALRLLLRIAITVVATLAVIYVGLTWIAPVGLSYYAARKALPVTRVVPTELPNRSVSDAPGKKLSYFGYEFEVPWSDLDETQTKFYPVSGPAKCCSAVLHFRSGLQMRFTAVPPHEWANRLAEEFHSSPQKVGLLFGSPIEMSDYDFKKSLFEFTPDKMHHWTFSLSTLYREQFVLILKNALTTSAEHGIFNIQNQSFRGFQEGYPQARQVSVVVQLFSDEGSADVIFSQGDNQKGTVVGQPEINRVIQTLRKAP
jgi:hypothetical protein